MGASCEYAVYKKVSGKLKELGTEKHELPKIKSIEYVVKDLHKKTVTELQELLHRQQCILKNKSFISKLPDKGDKLKSRCQEIEDALNKAISESELHNGCNKDNDKLCDSSKVNAFEWTKSLAGSKSDENVFSGTSTINLEEDEVKDPLELLVTHSCDVPTRKVKRNEEEDPASVIAKELSQLDITDNIATTIPIKDYKSASISSLPPESELEYNIRLLESLELKEKTNPIRKSFKPFRPLKNSLAEKKAATADSKKSPLWVESSATGPIEVSNSQPVKLISLQQSFWLYGKAQKIERENIYKAAKHSLAEYPKTDIGLPASVDLHYRDSNATIHILDESDEEEYEGIELDRLLEEEDESEND